MAKNNDSKTPNNPKDVVRGDTKNLGYNDRIPPPDPPPPPPPPPE